MRRPAVLASGRSKAIGVALLSLPVLALVVAALTSSQVPAAQPAEADRGSITVFDGQRWSWSGPSVCRPGAAPVPLSRAVGEEVEQLPVPLLTVTDLDAGGASMLVAVGRDGSCTPSVVLSSDDGGSWVRLPAQPAVAASIDEAGQVWLVPREEGSGRLQRVRPDGSLADVEVGCPEGTGLTQVAAASADRVRALCEDATGLRRTIAASDDGGTSWEWVADERSGSGLDGPGRALDLVMLDDRGWLLMKGRGCREAEIRSTQDGGRTWSTLPCPAESTPVGAVLSLDISSPQQGAMLALRGAQPVVAVTDDAGSSWSQITPAAPS